MNNHIELHSKDSFLKMHDAGKLAAEVLDYITDYVKPNVSTGYLNDLCHEFILRNNACLLYTSPSPRDKRQSRMPSSA